MTTVVAPPVFPGAAGVGTVDFGAAFPGSDLAQLVVIGQAAIVAGSAVQATIQATPTADHSADEHVIENIQVRAGNIVPGVGFTIYAQTNTFTLTGLWTVAWSWR